LFIEFLLLDDTGKSGELTPLLLIQGEFKTH